MAKAFCESPSYQYLFQDIQCLKSRAKALEWLFVRNLTLTVGTCPQALRGVLDTLNDNKVILCFLWTPGANQEISLWDMIRAGLWQVPFKFGMGTLKRVLRLVEAHELEAKESTKQHHQDDDDDDARTDIDTDFVHLERMVVLPEYQGQGWGSRALKETLESETRMVRLATQEERNVRFYQRLGFEIAGERDMFGDDDPDHKYHSWFLIRSAPTTSEEAL
jgi:ribosomal protein S18 acetylase RimI-like enzyme